MEPLAETIAGALDQRRLVQTACELVNVPSPTGEELAIGELLREEFLDLGLEVVWQEVEDERPNVLGTLRSAGGGPSLMLNGHIDTSYSGREPWLRGRRGFEPRALVEDGHIFGLGISNMKGALACYIEALRALGDASVRLRGDVVVAAVCGEIEKTQWGEDYRGRSYRGYGTGSQHLVTHGGITDLCLLGEPTEQRIVVGHYGSAWLRVSTHGPFVHTAFSRGRLSENSIVRMREVLGAVLEWIPAWEEKTSYRGAPGVVNVGAIGGGFPWRASRTPERTDLFLDVRTPPAMGMPEACARLKELGRELEARFPEAGIETEIYLTCPGAEIADDHPLVAAIEGAHEDVFGAPPELGSERWTADSSVLCTAGIETVNYGTSSGLPGAEGENLAIDGLVSTARVYAQTIARVCGVA